MLPPVMIGAAAVVLLAAGAFLLGWCLDLPVFELSAAVTLAAALLYGAARLGRAEIARARAVERFRAVFRSDMIGVAAWNADGDIDDANEAFLAMIGYARQDLPAGRLNWRNLAPPGGLDAHGVAGHPLPHQGGAGRHAQDCIRKDGARIPLLIDSASLAGEPGRWVSVVLDLTQRRSIEEQLRDGQNLQALGRTTGAAAHDLNNLLMIVMGNAEMLTAKLAGDARLLEMAELIGRAARRGADLAGRLLALARQQHPRPAAVDVNRLLAGMDDLLRRTLGEGIRLELVHGAELWPAMTDAAALETAILNLAIDARDAMPDGGCLTLTTANLRIDGMDSGRSVPLRPGQYVAVSFAGAGLSPEGTESIFATEEGGPGLGMARGLLKQSGGEISLDGESGKDAAVTMYLPRALDAAGPPAMAAGAPSPPAHRSA